VKRTVTARIPTADGAFCLHHFRSEWDKKNHLALVLGDAEGEDLLVRIHSECFTGDVLGSQRCDCGEQLTRAIQAIAAEGRGALIYLRQEGRGIGLEEKLRAYNLQDEGYDTVDANLLLGHQADERDYTAAALILQELGVGTVRMLTNNPAKIEGLAALGIAVRERIPLQMPSNPESHAYLETKVARMRHIIQLNGQRQPSEPHPPDPAETYRLQLNGLRARIHSHSDVVSAPPKAKDIPFVTLSYAQSLDGCLTTRQGTPFPISAPASLTMTHTLRAAHSAILVGIGTVLADDPALTVRLVAGDSPQPVIVDTHLRTPPDARLLRGQLPAWIATTLSGAQSSRRRCLEEAGARIFTLPTDENGRVDLTALLSCLGAEDVRSLMVEGGARILTGFLEKRLANYAVITIAPIFLGGYPLIQSARGKDELRAVMPRLQHVEQVQLVTDTVLWGEVA
jgi:3,4-dihydroxy 2-butanone 4-phosphate synthase/GTP cyclohydrolase II